jgi:hypothetical protein
LEDWPRRWIIKMQQMPKDEAEVRTFGPTARETLAVPRDEKERPLGCPSAISPVRQSSQRLVCAADCFARGKRAPTILPDFHNPTPNIVRTKSASAISSAGRGSGAVLKTPNELDAMGRISSSRAKVKQKISRFSCRCFHACPFISERQRSLLFSGGHSA